MSQPQPYVPAHAFVTDAANLPRFPGQQLDVEFQDIKATTDQVLANLKLIQRDDGALANGVVTYDSLSPSIQTGGLAPANAWVTGTAYTAGVSVVTNGGLYRCLIAHTAGVFATDLAAGKWLFVTALTVGVNGTNGTNGATGPGYGGTSTTSLLIANSTTKTFTTQAGLAYVVGSRIRATSAANVSNFMEGACTGYSGTSLSISVDNIGGSGTHADWMFTLAVALNANATSVQYDTIALAIAAPIPSSATTVLLLGRNAPGDLGGGLYKKLVSAPGTPRSWHWQNTAASSWWQLDTPRVNPRMFGTTGLGVADDRQPLQDSFDYISTLWPGGVVDGVPGDVYRCVINNGVTNLGLVLGTNVNTFGNGATINFECAGEVYGLRPKGKNLISGWTLATTVSSGLASPDQAIIHAPVALGTAYGSSGTVASPDPFVAPSDVEICGEHVDQRPQQWRRRHPPRLRRRRQHLHPRQHVPRQRDDGDCHWLRLAAD